MDCKKCRLPVITKDHPYIYCNGLCAAVHHAACVGLNNVELASVSPPNKNNMWLCDECVVEFVQWRKERSENKKCSIAESVSEPKCPLQRDVEELKNKVESMRLVLASHGAFNVDAEIRHSTPDAPNSSRQMSSNSRSREISDVLPDASDRLIDSIREDESYDLLLTNIDGSVTEDDIQRMVFRSLGAHDNEFIHVRKLVPRWVDCSTLDYISFKVVLNRKWKSSAMLSTTWPQNVKFREFRKIRCTWRPELV
nr:uncharacterized protein LOC115256359 [Aedes albopictus]